MSDEPVRLTCVIEAPVERVFGAWSEADQLRRWAWGQLGSDTEATVDCRVGGRYRVSTTRPDGAVWTFFGEYLECVPGERLVYTVEWDAPMGYESAGETVEVTLRPVERGTEIDFVHKGVALPVARDEHRKGWLDTLGALATLIEG